MAQDPSPAWFLLFAWIWVVIVIASSILFRRIRGKPIYPKIPERTLFVEKWASSMGASNCLLVFVTTEGLFVTPRFPFNLGFLAEIYGLERHIPAYDIRDVRTKFSLFGSNAIIHYGDRPRKLGLRLRKPQIFAAALSQLGVSSI